MPDLNFEMGVLDPVDHSQMRLKGQYTPAAVLVLIFERNREPCILLTKRTLNVRHHKGEISFPGGSRDKNDKTLLETALRETEEEMGILAIDIEVLGELDDTPTSSRFLITPYVGTIPANYGFSPSSIEVEEVIEIPLKSLIDDSNMRSEVQIVDGELKPSPTYVYNGHIVYGATARILFRFLELLRSVRDKETPCLLYTSPSPRD